MHRATRLRRLVVALLVVLLLAVASRVVRADAASRAPERATRAGASFAAAIDVGGGISLTFLLRRGAA